MSNRAKNSRVLSLTSFVLPVLYPKPLILSTRQGKSRLYPVPRHHNAGTIIVLTIS